MLCKKVVRSALGASRSSGSTGLISKRWIFPGSSPTDQTTEKTWKDTAAEKNQTPDGVTISHPGGAKIELHVPKTVGPGDPVKQQEEATLKYNLPATPPGAHMPRHAGSDEIAPMDADAYVGPAGTTTGPAGKVPTPFEQISKRRYTIASFACGDVHKQKSSTAAVAFLKQPVRSFSNKIEVNPGGARVAALDLQDDTKFVVDAAVAEFNEGKISGSQARQSPLEVSRFDEQHSEAALGSAEGSFATGVQRQAGQAQADSMGTGGFLNPPPGEVYDGAHNTPEIPEHGTPGTVKGANLSSVDADGAFGGASQSGAGHEQAEGMGTGGALNPPPGEIYTGGGLSSSGKGVSGSSGSQEAAPLKDANYSVTADSSVPPGGRGFFTAPAWFSGTPAESKTPGAGPKKDSYAEVKHLPDRPEPVDAGIVTDLQTGVNVIGGTPVKPQAQRMTHPDQLHRDTEGMQPEIDPVIQKMVPDENTTLAGRPH
ncbi:hypothetical protein WJX75_003402 [Coccomyxa subellipsoidea]|uniref:Uncharacterized protein n=1 Tax=Coccomyxa subellipsoidea TaxID=248742 RepID=A0ABR2Z0Y9_9CHLO